MESSEFIITAELARTAWGLAQVFVADVAEHADLGPEQLQAFEGHRAEHCITA